MPEQDAFTQNILGVNDLVSNPLNKLESGSRFEEGAVGEKIDAYELEMSDEELLVLSTEWETKYGPYESNIQKISERNKESYLGKRANGSFLNGDENLAANLQFESEETFLSATLARQPDPVVFADNTQEGNAIANSVKTMLQFHAKQLMLRARLQTMVRQWSIYHLGVLKYGWNDSIGDIEVLNRKIQDFIFDVNGYVDVYGDFVGYLGERIKVSAKRLIELFPKHKEYITLSVDGKLGTQVVYTEWWTDEFTFVTYKEKVLAKNKNQFFLYPEEQKDPVTGETLKDELGLPVISRPRNHFAIPKKPYTFLSVFSLQEQPHDITGLIEQNIPNQRLITKRTDQIDFNVSSANNSFAFSQDNFNEETAKQAANARRMGNPILVPSGGPIGNSVMPLDAQQLPKSVFDSLEVSKNDLRTSWGVQGITSLPGDEDQTARGMILNQSHDTTRIGGGIGEKIANVAESAFNWMVQMYYVFYDDVHFAAIMGRAKSTEFVLLTRDNLDRQLIVTVAPDSMKPKDEVNQMNMAQALFDKGAIGPVTLLKMLDFPDAQEAAADGMMYKLDPMGYFQLNFPEYFQRLQQQMMAQQQVSMGMQPIQGAPPEAQSEPAPQTVAPEPASASLSQVPLPQ